MHRVLVLALSFGVLASACADPHCPPGEVKIADTCYPARDAGADSAAPLDDDEDAATGAFDPAASGTADTGAPDAQAPLRDAPSDAQVADATVPPTADASRTDAATPTDSGSASASADAGPPATPPATPPVTMTPTQPTCKAGYELKNGTCTNIDECAKGNACTAKNQVCADTDGSFVCTCRALPNLIADPSFELQRSPMQIELPWSGTVSVLGGSSPYPLTRIQLASQDARSGTQHAVVFGDDGWDSESWREVGQTVKVQENTKYKLTAWVKTKGASPVQGTLGARGTGADWRISLASSTYSASSNYSAASVTIDSGSRVELAIYVGRPPDGPATLYVDDVVMERVSTDGACP